MTNWDLDKYIKEFNAKLVPAGFSYTSSDNEDFETVEHLRELIIQHVDPTFQV